MRITQEASLPFRVLWNAKGAFYPEAPFMALFARAELNAAADEQALFNL